MPTQLGPIFNFFVNKSLQVAPSVLIFIVHPFESCTDATILSPLLASFVHVKPQSLPTRYIAKKIQTILESRDKLYIITSNGFFSHNAKPSQDVDVNHFANDLTHFQLQQGPRACSNLSGVISCHMLGCSFQVITLSGENPLILVC